LVALLKIEFDITLLESAKISKIPHILEIIDANVLQNIQDFFANKINIPIVCFSDGDWLALPSNHKSFCSKYINCNKKHLYKCHECHANWENEAKKQNKPIISKCHAGISGIAVPISVQGQYIGCILSGQFLLQPLTQELLNQIIKNLNLNPKNKLIEDLKQIRILSDKDLNTIIEVLYLVGNSIASIAYANLKFAELGLDEQTINNKSIEKWFSNNYNQVKTALTNREREILELITAGKNNNEIAKELFISVHTVKAHVSSIIEKFGVEDRVQVAVKATKEGIV